MKEKAAIKVKAAIRALKKYGFEATKIEGGLVIEKFKLTKEKKQEVLFQIALLSFVLSILFLVKMIEKNSFSDIGFIAGFLLFLLPLAISFGVFYFVLKKRWDKQEQKSKTIKITAEKIVIENTNGFHEVFLKKNIRQIKGIVDQRKNPIKGIIQIEESGSGMNEILRFYPSKLDPLDKLLIKDLEYDMKKVRECIEFIIQKVYYIK